MKYLILTKQELDALPLDVAPLFIKPGYACQITDTKGNITRLKSLYLGNDYIYRIESLRIKIK